MNLKEAAAVAKQQVNDLFAPDGWHIGELTWRLSISYFSSH
jgi:hypothetical protein